VNHDDDRLPVILLTETSAAVPALIGARGPHAGGRFVEFFTANIRNPNTRKAYYRATSVLKIKFIQSETKDGRVIETAGSS
jgi:hypothetical protein